MASNSEESSTSMVNENQSLTSDNTASEENPTVEVVESQTIEIIEEVKNESTNDEEGEKCSTETVVEELKTTETKEIDRNESEKPAHDSIPSEKIIQTAEEKPKSRSVKFSSIDDEIEETKPMRTSSSVKTKYSSSSYKPSRRPVDFIDALVESYKLETSTHHEPLNSEERKYVPKTTRSRLNPNWREHRTRRLMNKLEELSLWDREEEMKASQAQSLREQKWEQIQDRQRNHDLCLSLMRQRHESEMESAVVLDRASVVVNDENKAAAITRTLKLATPVNGIGYDGVVTSSSLKRRVRKDKDHDDDEIIPKTPIGRYRQFETKMNDKIDKINQKIQPDHEIMSAYNPNRISIPTSAVPLFSETYSALISVPDPLPSNKYNQYHYGVASYLHQPNHAPSPDYEIHRRFYSNRDVRVPLKEQANDYNYYDDEPVTNSYTRSLTADDEHSTKYRSNIVDDDYYPTKNRSIYGDEDPPTKYRSSVLDDDNLGKYRSPSSSSRLGYSPPRRTTNSASPTASSLYDYSTVTNTPRDYSFLHSRPPSSNSIHQRSLNDDLNAITRYSTEASKKILNSVADTPNGFSSKTRSTASSTGKRVSFHDHDDENDDFNARSSHYSRHNSSKSTHEPIEIISLSSSR